MSDSESSTASLKGGWLGSHPGPPPLSNCRPDTEITIAIQIAAACATGIRLAACGSARSRPGALAYPELRPNTRRRQYGHGQLHAHAPTCASTAVRDADQAKAIQVQLQSCGPGHWPAAHECELRPPVHARSFRNTVMPVMSTTHIPRSIHDVNSLGCYQLCHREAMASSLTAFYFHMPSVNSPSFPHS